MLKFAFAICGFVLMTTAAGAADAPSFEVGQKWTIKDSGMTIVVGAVEPFASDKTAVSVSVFDVPCPASGGCVTTNVAHAPFDATALAQSVDKLIETHASPAPSFEEGYANWKNAKGGIFTVPVGRLPDLLFHALSDGKPVQTAPSQKS